MNIFSGFTKTVLHADNKHLLILFNAKCYFNGKVQSGNSNSKTVLSCNMEAHITIPHSILSQFGASCNKGTEKSLPKGGEKDFSGCRHISMFR